MQTSALKRTVLGEKMAEKKPSFGIPGVADLLDAHIRGGQLGKAEEADKVVSGEAGDVQAGLEVLQDCLHDYAQAACLQQLLQVLPQLPQQLRLHLRCRPALHLKCIARRFCVVLDKAPE